MDKLYSLSGRFCFVAAGRSRHRGYPPGSLHRTSAARQRPYGDEGWVRRTAARLGLEFTLRPRGRPRKGEKE